jgi:beta-glucosidase
MTAQIEKLIAQMTLEEKAALCTGAGSWTSLPIDRLEIPEITVSDGPHGVRRVVSEDGVDEISLPATCFPTASCLASTWDTDLIYRMGEALGEESIALGVDILLGPGVNMKRSPLGGRNFEYYSEDPYLAGEMAASFIQGVQSKGVGTSLKHFAANNQEYQRFSIDALIDERTLREIYLPAFEKAVKAAQPWTVMCSYNKINGDFAAEHRHTLTEILKEEWGFEGFVVSDWGAVRNRVASLKAGLDWEMPGPRDYRVQEVVAAVRSGELDPAVLDESVRRILRIIFKARETPKGGSFDVNAHHELAHQIADEGIVLLKNDGLLPLKGFQKIAVIGRSAEKAHFQGGGSSHIKPTRVDVPFVEIQKQAEGAEFTYIEGYPEDNSLQPQLIDRSVQLAGEADVAIVFIALPSYKESEGYDRTDLDLTEQQLALIEAVSAVQPKTVVILNNGAPVVMSAWLDKVSAVIEGWMMGQAGGAAIADVLFGRVNPSGKLAETFPLKLADTPAYLNWPGETGQVRYGEGLFIGYRYYDQKEMPVQFPFGFGLSYTRFAYSNARVSAAQFKDVDGVTVQVDVTNTGAMAGKEIVQVYVHDQNSSLIRPQKELKGFAKVALEPGETKTVSIFLDFRAFAFYHPEYRQWITEDGDFDLLVGSSSADIRATLPVNLQSTVNLPFILDEDSTVKEWLDDLRSKTVLMQFMAQMDEESQKVFAEGTEGEQNSIGMNTWDSMIDMPLMSVLMFAREKLPVTPEELVASLLAQARAMDLPE